MLKRLRSYFRRAKTDILIGAMSFTLYILLGFVFFYCLSLNNPFLVKISRTLATTLLTFTAMTAAMAIHILFVGR